MTQITSKLSVSQVEVQDSSASLFAQSSDGSRLGFLVKMTSGGISLEGRGEDKELLAGVLEELAKIIDS